MDTKKDIKIANATPIFITVFLFIRAVILTNWSHVNLRDFILEGAKLKEGIILLVLFFVFSVLASVIYKKISNLYGSLILYLSIFLVTEPLFFVKQTNIINMFVVTVGLIFILNSLRDKPIIPNEISLILFIVLSTILLKHAVFLYVCLALIIYLFSDSKNFLKSPKKLIMFALSVISTAGGMHLNNYLVSNYPEYDNFIKTYTFHQYVYFKHIPYEKPFLLIFTIPMVVLGFCFFFYLAKNVKQEHNRRKNKKGAKTEPDDFNHLIVIYTTIITYIVSIIGFILYGSQAFYTVNLIIPMIIISLLKCNIPSVNKTMMIINTFIEKHSFIFIVVLVILNYLSIRVFYSDIENLASFAVLP